MRTLGKYTILEQLGAGAMGAVHRARDTVLERYVAIKIIYAGADLHSEVRERFYREARAYATLRHPHIVTIYDLGEQDNEAYIVMELLEGADLGRIIAQRQALPLAAKIELAAQVAEGLAHAHRHGIIHRDVKPGNIFIHQGNCAKILDFGIARVPFSRLTQAGSALGTPEYMAPEQITTRVCDARSDLFAAAIVFYEFLVYTHPFRGRHRGRRIVSDTPEPLWTADPHIPGSLEKVIARGLEKDPERRYQTGDEFAAALRAVRLDMTLAHPAGNIATGPAVPGKAQADPGLGAAPPEAGTPAPTTDVPTAFAMPRRRRPATPGSRAGRLRADSPLPDANQPPAPASPHEASAGRGEGASRPDEARPPAGAVPANAPPLDALFSPDLHGRGREAKPPSAAGEASANASPLDALFSPGLRVGSREAGPPSPAGEIPANAPPLDALFSRGQRGGGLDEAPPTVTPVEPLFSPAPRAGSRQARPPSPAGEVPANAPPLDARFSTGLRGGSLEAVPARPGAAAALAPPTPRAAPPSLRSGQKRILAALAAAVLLAPALIAIHMRRTVPTRPAVAVAEIVSPEARVVASPDERGEPIVSLRQGDRVNVLRLPRSRKLEWVEVQFLTPKKTYRAGFLNNSDLGQWSSNDPEAAFALIQRFGPAEPAAEAEMLAQLDKWAAFLARFGITPQGPLANFERAQLYLALARLNHQAGRPAQAWDHYLDAATVELAMASAGTDLAARVAQARSELDELKHTIRP